MGKFSDALKRRLNIGAGKEKADWAQANMERISDPMLCAVSIKNRIDIDLIFESTLEINTPLEEAKAWKVVRLKPDEEKVFPHIYFNVTNEDGRDCTYTVKPAPKNSDFVYSMRKEFSGNSGVLSANPDSQSEVSDNQP